MTTRYRYSPLGWAQWLYGPLAMMFGVGIIASWYNEVQHQMANGGFGRSTALDYAMWAVFLGFGVVVLVGGIVFVSFDRVTEFSPDGGFTTWRGRIIPWHREHFAKNDVTWSVEKVPIIMVIGKRVTTPGFRWRVVATLKSRKRRRIVSLRSTEAEARRDLANITK